MTDGEKATEPVGEANVNGEALPRSWKATVAVIWAGQAVSVFATVAATFSAMWYIVEALASPLALSLAAVASLLPVAALSPVGGAVADRHRRKRVMVAADGCAGLVSLVLGAIVLVGDVHMWMLLVMLAIRACAQAFHAPALTATMPLMVPERHLVRINALDQMLTSGAAVAGPAIGIFLYTTFGFAAVLFIDAAAAFIACACLFAAHIPQPSLAKPGRGVFAGMAQGFRLVFDDRPLFLLLAAYMAAMLVFAPLSTLFPLITYEWFSGDGYMASIIEVAGGIGLLAGSGVLLAWGGGKRLVPAMMGAGLAIAALTIAVGYMQGAPFFLFATAAALIMTGLGVFNGPIMPIMQQRLPQESMAQAMGVVLSLSACATPIGLVACGFGASAFGIGPWFVGSGIVLGVLCLAGLASKALSSLDER